MRTPKAPDLAAAARRGAAKTSTPTPTSGHAVDVFGRIYNTAVPVFMQTGTRLVFDRLHTKNPDGSGAVLLDVDDLNALAKKRNHAWQENEFGEAPPEWLASRPHFGIGFAPGYGDSESGGPIGPLDQWDTAINDGWKQVSSDAFNYTAGAAQYPAVTFRTVYIGYTYRATFEIKNWLGSSPRMVIRLGTLIENWDTLTENGQYDMISVCMSDEYDGFRFIISDNNTNDSLDLVNVRFDRVEPEGDYATLDLHPLWSTPGANITATMVDGEVAATINTTPAIWQFAEFANIKNGYAEVTYTWVNSTDQMRGYHPALRIADIGETYPDCIGVRSFDGELQLHDRVANVATTLFAMPQPDGDCVVRLEAVGDQVTMLVNGETYGPWTCRTIDAGITGTVIKSTATYTDPYPRKIFKDFTAGPLDPAAGVDADPITDLGIWTSPGAPNVYMVDDNIYFRATAPEAALTFNAMSNELDAAVRATVINRSSTNQTSSFLLAGRMSDDCLTLVGVRSYSGEFQVYERIDGAWTVLGTLPQEDRHQQVTLTITGTNVKVNIDGSSTNYTTAVTTPGHFGIAARAWQGDQPMMTAFTGWVVV